MLATDHRGREYSWYESFEILAVASTHLVPSLRSYRAVSWVKLGAS